MVGNSLMGGSIRLISRIVLTRPGSPVEESWGIIMRKLALLIAAALLVSVPLAATTSTDSYAAAKKAKKAAKGEGGKAASASPEEANSAWIRALSGDISRIGASDEGAKGGKGKAKKAKKS
jgi:hypothetical protein